MNLVLGYNNYYGAPLWAVFGDELSVRCWVVGSMFPPSIFEDRCVNFRRSICRLSKIDVSTSEDQCVDLRRSMMDVPTSKLRSSTLNNAAIVKRLAV